MNFKRVHFRTPNIKFVFTYCKLGQFFKKQLKNYLAKWTVAFYLHVTIYKEGRLGRVDPFFRKLFFMF